jgi:hypothetical protein
MTTSSITLGTIHQALVDLNEKVQRLEDLLECKSPVKPATRTPTRAHVSRLPVTLHRKEIIATSTISSQTLHMQNVEINRNGRLLFSVNGRREYRNYFIDNMPTLDAFTIRFRFEKVAWRFTVMLTADGASLGEES